MVVKIIKAFDIYPVGTLAGFDAKQTKVLIDNGYAVAYSEKKPDLPSPKKTVTKD